MRNKENIPIISIIVPIYNVEEYVEACIRSILAQSFVDFELILVDDGSTDKSGFICDQYSEKDSRIRVVHIINGGAAEARNVGLNMISGKYVTFVDSDDIVEKDYLAVLYHAIIQSQAEIATCENIDFTDEKDIIVKENNVQYNVVSGKEVLNIRYRKGFNIAVWGKIYRRDILDDMRFPVGRCYEDQGFTPQVLYRASRVCLTNQILYYYRIRKDSLAHAPFSSRCFDNIELMNDFINFLEEKQEKELAREAKWHRDKVLALYTIMANYAGIVERPKGCRMKELKALRILKKTNTEDKYSWFLSLVHPKGLRIHYYIRKIETVITKRK